MQYIFCLSDMLDSKKKQSSTCYGTKRNGKNVVEIVS